MKRHKSYIGTQTELFKNQKNENLENINRLTTKPNKEDIYMIYYFCKEHGLSFWHNPKKHYGLCSFCREEFKFIIDEKIHIKDNEITNEIIKMVKIKLGKYYDDIEYKEVNNVKVQETVEVKDGKYDGTIINVIEITEPFEYVHFVIAFDVEGSSVQFDFSCPSNITIDKETKKPKSKLAITFDEFGFKVEKDKDVSVNDIKKYFEGKNITSLLSSKTKDNKTYVEVMTMKPKE